MRNHRSNHRSTNSENQGNQQQEEVGNNVGIVYQNSHDNQQHEGGENNVQISNGDNDRPFFIDIQDESNSKDNVDDQR